MSEFVYQVNDLVWAKMKGFPPWPGKISDLPPELKKRPKDGWRQFQCVFFFGCNIYVWIEEYNIKPYKQFKEQLMNSSKSAAFKEAVVTIETYIKNHCQIDAES